MEFFILVVILLKTISCSNSKLKLRGIIYSNTDKVYQNTSFQNFDNGEILVNLTQTRFVPTFSETVSLSSHIQESKSNSIFISPG